jgi:hypothetical protein
MDIYRVANKGKLLGTVEATTQVRQSKRPHSNSRQLHGA